MKTFALCVLASAALTAAAYGGGGREKETPAGDLFSGGLSGTITVSAYESGTYRAFLEEAARGFEALHPGTAVTVETFSAMPEVRSGGEGGNRIMTVQSRDDPQGRGDYISRVNTGLMSGEGADIYAMDVLPLDKLVEGGRLENLETYMNGDPGFNRADYRENIIEAARYRNGLWILPADYNFNYFSYDATLVPAAEAANFGTDKAWTYEALMEIGQKYYDGSAKVFNLMDIAPGGSMTEELFAEHIGEFVDLENKRANFSGGAFVNTLEAVTRYAEQGLIPRGTMAQRDPGEMMRAGMEQAERFFFKSSGSQGLLSLFTRGMGMRMMIQSAGSAAAINDDDEIAGIAANAGGTVPFEYSHAYGISSQSKNKALAWAFLKYLLGEEAQLSTALSIAANPLHNQARYQKTELVFSGAFMGRPAGPMTEAMRSGLEAYRVALEALSDQINSFVVLDATVMDMIAAEGAYYFAGTRTAAEAASVLQNKVDLYLNE
jgi:multiple sugar transport system substrate-binding protein